MNERTCSVDGCGRPHLAKDLCSVHYHRHRRHGSFEAKVPRLRGSTLREKLTLNYTVSPEGCWRWNGGHDIHGYGTISVGEHTRGVHRVVYEEFVGPIPHGFQVDHVAARGCVHKDCTNPAHLEAVTVAENMRRRSAAVTHCPQGHEYTPENTYRHAGRRHCRACRRERKPKERP